MTCNYRFSIAAVAAMVCLAVAGPPFARGDEPAAPTAKPKAQAANKPAAKHPPAAKQRAPKAPGSDKPSEKSPGKEPAEKSAPGKAPPAKSAGASVEATEGNASSAAPQASQAAEFGIGELEPGLGPYGPKRESNEFYPGETLTFRFDVDQPRLDEKRQFDVAFSYRLLDTEGKAKVAESYPIAGAMWLDVERVRYHLEFKLPDDLPIGDYTLEVSCIDNGAGRQATKTHTLKVKPAEFALVSPRFYYDAACSIPSPVGGLRGQDLHFQIEVLGEDRKSGKADLVFDMQVYDERGEKISRLDPIEWQLNQPAFLVDRTKHPLFSGHLALLRTGKFTLKVTATDRTTGKSTAFETPLRVATLDESLTR